MTTSPMLTPHLAAADIPDRFFIDIAVGVQSFEDLCAAYQLRPESVTAVSDDPRFLQRAALAKQAVEDDGRAFRARCRTIVNDSVGHMAQLMRNPETPPSTQLETFKTLAKYGELEPETGKATADNGPQLVFTIIAPDGAQFTMGQPMTPPPEPAKRVERNVTPIDVPPAGSDAASIGVDALGF